MRSQWSTVAGAVLLTALVAFVFSPSNRAASQAALDNGGADYRLAEADAEAAGARHLSPELRAAGLRFAPGTTAHEQQLVLSAIGGARPQARRLIELVDGLTTLRVGSLASGNLGEAESRGGSYEVRADVALAWSHQGARGVQQLVLHELGHVVDYALVGDGLIAELDAGIPQGVGCDEGYAGGCAPLEERFADTFSKWATGDLGFELYQGYKIPPPSMPLARWGEPLAALAG